MEALTAPVAQPGQEDEGAGAGRGSKGRRASGAGGGASSSSSSGAAALAADKAMADAIKAQAKELHEALAANRQRLPALEKDAQQVLAVAEKRKR